MKYLLSAAICFHSNTKCTTRITSGHAPSHGGEITHRTFCTYIQKRITKHFREIMRNSWRPQPATQTDFYNLAALQQSAKPAKEKSQQLPLLLILALCHTESCAGIHPRQCSSQSTGLRCAQNTQQNSAPGLIQAFPWKAAESFMC